MFACLQGMLFALPPVARCRRRPAFLPFRKQKLLQSSQSPIRYFVAVAAKKKRERSRPVCRLLRSPPGPSSGPSSSSATFLPSLLSVFVFLLCRRLVIEEANRTTYPHRSCSFQTDMAMAAAGRKKGRRTRGDRLRLVERGEGCSDTSVVPHSHLVRVPSHSAISVRFLMYAAGRGEGTLNRNDGNSDSGTRGRVAFEGVVWESAGRARSSS